MAGRALHKFRCISFRPEATGDQQHGDIMTSWNSPENCPEQGCPEQGSLPCVLRENGLAELFCVSRDKYPRGRCFRAGFNRFGIVQSSILAENRHAEVFRSI